MVRAVAKVGPRAGQPLWRCSDFSCPELVNIDEGDITPRQPAAGESAQAQFERERAAFRERAKQMFTVFAVLPVLFATIGFLATAWATADVRLAGIVGLLVAGVTVAYLTRYLPTEVVWWRKGAEAERAVGARLDSLAPLGFVTLYDRRFVGRGGNIDAVTVGPPGLFVVETKHRGRSVEVVAGRLDVGNRTETDDPGDPHIRGCPRGREEADGGEQDGQCGEHREHLLCALAERRALTLELGLCRLPGRRLARRDVALVDVHHLGAREVAASPEGLACARSDLCHRADHRRPAAAALSGF